MWFKFDSTKRLERRLSEVGVEVKSTVLKQEHAAGIKKRLMASIHNSIEKSAGSLEVSAVNSSVSGRFLGNLKQVALTVVPRDFFRILLKEKLLTLVDINSRTSLRRDFSHFFLSRKFAAGVTVFVLIASVFFNFTLDVHQAQASITTIIDEMSGDVFIVRDGVEIAATPGLLLKGEDIVRTGSGAHAIIRFLDQSVTRLDENTEVKISKLFINPHNKTETIVELVLSKGRMWTRVINLIDNLSHFQVKAGSAIAVARKKAAFDVSVDPRKKAKISAISHGVDLVVATNRQVVETTLVKGYSAEIKNVAAESAPVISHDNEQKNSETWIESNLEQDRQYIDQVKKNVEEDGQNNAGFLPGNPLYAVKELSHDTQIALTIDDVSRQKKILSAAQQKLVEAQALLTQGNTDKANALLSQFKTEVAGVGEWAGKYPAETLDVVGQVGELLSASQKQLSLMLPDDPLYPAKQTIEETQVLVAADSQQKTEARLAQAGSKLLEAQELIEQGNPLAAQKQVEKYTETLTDLVSDMKKLPSGEQEKAVGVLLDTKREDLKVLETITVKPAIDTAVLPQAQPLTPEDAAIGAPGFMTEPLTGKTDAQEGAKNAPQLVQGTETQSLEQASPEAATTEVLPPSTPSAMASEPVSAKLTPLEQSVSQAKTETLTKLGEAVLEVQKTQASPIVMQKLQQIKNVDINGKPLINFQLRKNKVIIKSDGTTISLPSAPPDVPAAPSSASSSPASAIPKTASPATPPPTIDSKTPGSLPAQP